jgi:hypothetical protein
MTPEILAPYSLKDNQTFAPKNNEPKDLRAADSKSQPLSTPKAQQICNSSAPGVVA